MRIIFRLYQNPEKSSIHKENVKLSNNAALKVLFFNGENFKIFDFKGPKIYNFYALRNKIRKRIKKYWEEQSEILEYIAVKFGFEGENPLTDFHYSYEEKKQYKIYDGVPSLFEYIEAPAIQGAKFLVVVTKPLRKAIQLIYKSKTAQKLFIFIDKKIWSKIPKETQIAIVKRIRKAGGEIAQKGAGLSTLKSLANKYATKLGLKGNAKEKYIDNFLTLTGGNNKKVVDPGGPIFFGQKGASPTFSANHILYKDKKLEEVAKLLKEGKISTDDFPVYYVIFKGKRVTMNNRSLTVLSMAGKKPTKLINNTGKLSPEGSDSAKAFLERLHEMGNNPSKVMHIRKTKDWNSPIDYSVKIID